jgi:hypothetical protein
LRRNLNKRLRLGQEILCRFAFVAAAQELLDPTRVLTRRARGFPGQLSGWRGVHACFALGFMFSGAGYKKQPVLPSPVARNGNSLIIPDVPTLKCCTR